MHKCEVAVAVFWCWELLGVAAPISDRMDARVENKTLIQGANCTTGMADRVLSNQDGFSDKQGDDAKSAEIRFRLLGSEELIDLGEVSGISPQVINGRFNVALSLSTKVILQINALACDGQLKEGTHKGDEFRVVLMNTPWGDSALVGEDKKNWVKITNVDAARVKVEFSFLVAGHGKNISISGSFITARNHAPSFIGNQSN